MKPKLMLTVITFFVTMHCLTAQVDKIAQMSKDLPINYKGSVDERYLISSEVNSTFKLNIYIPGSYNESEDVYPIIILTDACSGSGIAQTTFDVLSWIKTIPEVIVIGIDYPYTDMTQLQRYRFRDMMPTHVEGYEPSGDADKFISFIEKELFPYIQNNYRVDTTDRAFYGHSAGGNLGSHILLEKPYLFNRYVLGSPGYYWDDNEIIKRIQGMDKVGGEYEIVIYSYVEGNASDGMLNNWNTFNNLLKEKISSQIHFRDQIYKDEGHFSVSLSAFSTAIKFIYSNDAQ
jgi:predicted alpha/beta superfamily hydrolase